MDEDLPIITFGLFWHSPNSSNLGVGALTLSNIAIIREAAKIANVKPFFKIFGFVDNRDIYVCGDDITVIALNSKRVFFPWSDLGKKISGCDVILDIGGGDSYTDIYGLKRFLFLNITKIRTVCNNVPLIYSPQTLGPFKHWYTRVIARIVTRKAKLVFARDQMSYDYGVNALGIDSEKIFLTTDVAFALPYEKSKRDISSILKIGINVSGLLFNGGYKRQNEFGLTVDYPSLIRQTITFLNHEPCEIYLTAHVISDDHAVEDDYAICQMLADEFKNVKVLSPSHNPVDAKTAISKMDLFIGARMHACIAAFSSGVPVIPMAYSRKFNGLFGSLGYHHTLDCLSTNDEEAFEHIKISYQNISLLKEDTQSSVEMSVVKIGVYKSKLAELMTEIIHHD